MIKIYESLLLESGSYYNYIEDDGNITPQEMYKYIMNMNPKNPSGIKVPSKICDSISEAQEMLSGNDGAVRFRQSTFVFPYKNDRNGWDGPYSNSEWNNMKEYPELMQIVDDCREYVEEDRKIRVNDFGFKTDDGKLAICKNCDSLLNKEYLLDRVDKDGKINCPVCNGYYIYPSYAEDRRKEIDKIMYDMRDKFNSIAKELGNTVRWYVSFSSFNNA